MSCEPLNLIFFVRSQINFASHSFTLHTFFSLLLFGGRKIGLLGFSFFSSFVSVLSLPSCFIFAVALASLGDQAFLLLISFLFCFFLCAGKSQTFPFRRWFFFDSILLPEGLQFSSNSTLYPFSSRILSSYPCCTHSGYQQNSLRFSIRLFTRHTNDF